MPVIVENLADSRKDQNGSSRRLSRDLQRLSSRLRIGGQRIPIGKPVSISNDTYAANKATIDKYCSDGLISIKMVGEEPVKQEKPKQKRKTRGKAKPKVVESVQKVSPPSPPPPAPPVVTKEKPKEVSKEAPKEESAIDEAAEAAKEARLSRRLRKKSD